MKNKSRLEVEIKVKAKRTLMEKKLREWKIPRISQEEQIDIYYTHPCRDFKISDEVLRVRCSDTGFFLTYKGPRMGKQTKVREEIELKVNKDIYLLLERLRFRRFGEVKKKRETYRMGNFSINLDEVERLGDFLEIETSDLEEQEEMIELLEKLGISQRFFIIKSYLELLNESTQLTNPTKKPGS